MVDWVRGLRLDEWFLGAYLYGYWGFIAAIPAVIVIGLPFVWARGIFSSKERARRRLIRERRRLGLTDGLPTIVLIPGARRSSWWS